ncbi:MAG: AAA family ATPase, partial [Planctomycetes bacterium]|nr:AAA family ATPase [Planctomycetota bacterium]
MRGTKVPSPRKRSKKGRNSRGSKSTATQQDSAEGITGISVRGYKSLAKECNIEIRPLTILAGANSSGKSSAIQPLLLLKQTLEATYDPGALLLLGANVRFTDAHQLLSKIPGQPAGDDFSVNLRIAQSNLSLLFRKPKGKPFELQEMIYSSEDAPIVFRPDMSHKEISSVIPKEFDQLRASLMKGTKVKAQWRAFRERCFLGIRLRLVSGKREEYVPLAVSPSGLYEQHVRNVIHVPGLRGNPERTYTTTRIGQTFHGTFENYVASVINHWQNAEDKRIKELEKDLELLGLTWKIEAKQIEFAAYAAWRNRVLAAAAGAFALSFSGLQVEVVRATPGLTNTWPPLMVALGIGVFSAAVEMADNRLVAHRDGVPHTKWWARDEIFFWVHRWL